MESDRMYVGRNPAVSHARLDDEIVLLNVDTGDCYTLDKVGARLWELADGTRTIPELVRAIVQEFDVAEERAGRDVRVLVKDWLSEELASLDEEPRSAKENQGPT